MLAGIASEYPSAYLDAHKTARMAVRGIADSSLGFERIWTRVRRRSFLIALYANLSKPSQRPGSCDGFTGLVNSSGPKK